MSFTLTIRSITIGAFWLIGIAVALADAIYAPSLAALSMAFMVAAATLSVRGAIDRYAADWERAYDAGREVTHLRRRG